MVLDPWSAASRPMLPFDTLPSRPLRFADTLQPIDPNTSSLNKLPKPKRHHEQPKSYPVPAYSHTRHDSTASVQDTILNLNLGTGTERRGHVIGSDEWMQDEVAKCVDAAKGDLDIAGRGLRVLSTKISDLRHLVTLPSSYSPKPRLTSASPRAPLQYSNISLGSPHLSANARSFTRTASAPASSAYFNQLNNTPEVGLGPPPQIREESNRRVTFNVNVTPAAGPSTPPRSTADGLRKRTLGRSQTGAAIDSDISRAKEINIYAGQNQLTTLPTALFEISNLTLLSLRGNQLSALPAAIGELRHLRDLNISNNQITELPSTILQLNLTLFTAHPNKFHPAEPEPRTVKYHEFTVPRLTKLCTDLLISPRPPSNLPPLLGMYDWEFPNGVPHPLLDPAALHQIIPHITEKDLARVLQGLRAASSRITSLTSRHSNLPFTDPFPRSHRSTPPDDAGTNPYFYPCPSPRHQEMDESPRRHIFLHPAEERLEWRDVFGSSGLPVRWLGCSPGCLAFLDAEEDEWEIDSEGEQS